jgi:YD repeat-containing protein
VFQYSGVDSLNKKLVSEEFYNSKGQLTSYYYMDYKESSFVGNSDSKYFIFYQDTLLVLSTSIDEDKDSSKTIYYYNAAGQKIKEEHFNYKRRLKKDSDKGLRRPGGCIVTEKDYEKNKTWEKTSEINFQYDSNGNKILYDATKLHFSSQNKYTWKYDEQNRIVEHSSYDDTRLIWTEQFEYFNQGYKFTRTWFDYDGTPKQLKEKSWEYWPQYTFTYKLSTNGQVIEEKVMTEKGELTSSETTHYNSSGKIIKKTNFDSKGQPDITHIYIYE